VILISGEEGLAFGYQDEELDDGTFLYFGEGQVGPMTFDHGNKAIRDHSDNGEELHLFEKVRDTFIRYRGQYHCSGYELVDSVPDANGDPREAIVFSLVPDSQLAELGELTTAAIEGDDEEERQEPLDDLRRVALANSVAHTSPSEARVRVWRRSKAVHRYVLTRAQGTCEGCGQQAPFVRRDREPYLEPHHVRRLSDSGPDDPRWVIALCPNCHRQAHYALDAEEFNLRLRELLGTIEPI
jgi:5-methylcytosine-specific restriction protein A